MYQHIAEGDDPWELLNGCRCSRIKAGQLVERLANNLKLALYGRAKVVISAVLCERLARSKPRNTFCGLLPFLQQLATTACQSQDAYTVWLSLITRWRK